MLQVNLALPLGDVLIFVRLRRRRRLNYVSSSLRAVELSLSLGKDANVSLHFLKVT